MAWVDPKNDYAGDVVTNAELNQRANNQIQLGSFLHLGTALKSLASGTELHYDMSLDSSIDTTERTYTPGSADTWEFHSTVTKTTAMVAVSTRPIIVLAQLKVKVASASCLVRISKYNGSGGTVHQAHANRSNTAYLSGDPFTLLCGLESPVKGNSYVFGIQVYGVGATPLISVDDLYWFVLSL